MRIKPCLCNLSNRITFHLFRSGVMVVLCIAAEGFHNKCFSISMIKTSLIIGVSHLQLLNPTMSACLLFRKAGTNLISTARHQWSEHKGEISLWHMMKDLWQQQVALVQTPTIQLMVLLSPISPWSYWQNFTGEKQDISIPFHIYCCTIADKLHL